MMHSTQTQLALISRYTMNEADKERLDIMIADGLLHSLLRIVRDEACPFTERNASKFGTLMYSRLLLEKMLARVESKMYKESTKNIEKDLTNTDMGVN